MKKTRLFVVVFLVGMMIIPGNVYARESMYDDNRNYTQEESVDEFVDELFEGMDENKHILRMEDGGYLQGQCTIVDTEDPTIVYGYYDSETDANAMTLQEAKEEIRAIENGEITVNVPQIRAAGVPSDTRVMPAGSYYVSQNFASQAGWRFGGLLFQCAPGSVGTQKWQTYKDSGRVGRLGDAINQLNNPASSFGFEVYPGSPMYLGTKYNWGYASFCYYTYAPISGTYYRVDFS